MRWQRRGPSEDLEDRRGDIPARAPIRFPLPGGRGSRMSLGGAVALVAVMWLLGVNPIELLGGGVGANVGIDPGAPAGAFSASPEEEELVQFVSFVLDDLQDTWRQLLPDYRNAHLVLFRDATHSACGTGQSEMGPFYCPGDE
jgi:predicted metalloprotease